MFRNNWALIALVGFGLSALVVILTFQSPGTLAVQDNQMRLVYLVLLLVLVGSSLLAGWRDHTSLALRHAFTWIAIGIVLVAGYSFRYEFVTISSRMAGEIWPATPIERGDGSISLRAGQDGHFYAQALVNGTNVRFMVDTGASDVALSASDARRLGIDPAQLRFTRTYSTANGTVQGARVVLDEIRVGSISVRNVDASVTRGDGLSQSLLGMSFLRELRSVQLDGDRLILRQ
ncbi:TIGR02281 family clan AA aspartic protease [Pyruvatibacter sp.]|uniref:retropepsin-like aspartic protease family protein n=1 Tax=Pyruvatibacter sp. TaxID=1981328 RepID=UPI0032EDD388